MARRSTKSAPYRTFGLVSALCLCLVFAQPSPAAQSRPAADIQVTVLNAAAQPVAGVHLDITADGTLLTTAVTDSAGHATIRCAPHPACVVTAKSDGYQTIELPVEPTDSDLQFQLTPALARTEDVTVHAEAQDPLAVAESGENKLSVPEATQTPRCVLRR